MINQLYFNKIKKIVQLLKRKVSLISLPWWGQNCSMQNWGGGKVLHPSVGSSAMNVLSWARFLTANVQMRFPLWVPNVGAETLQNCWWKRSKTSVSLQVTELGPCAFNFMQKKIPVEKIWVSTHWDRSHHIFFCLINISWPVNQQSVILLIKKKVL